MGKSIEVPFLTHSVLAKQTVKDGERNDDPQQRDIILLCCDARLHAGAVFAVKILSLQVAFAGHVKCRQDAKKFAI